MVGRLLHVSARQIARYEAGDSDPPLGYAAGLARLAGVSLDELAGLPREDTPLSPADQRLLATVSRMCQEAAGGLADLERRLAGHADSDGSATRTA